MVTVRLNKTINFLLALHIRIIQLWLMLFMLLIPATKELLLVLDSSNLGLREKTLKNT